MTESDRDKLLLSLQQEVQALKSLVGGVLSDLQSRLYNVETKYIRPPDFENSLALVVRSGSLGDDIVNNWDAAKQPYESIVIPREGWLIVNAHAENKRTNTSSTHQPTGISIYIGSRTLGGADASTSVNHVESTNSWAVPVKVGDVVRWGSASASISPNGYYNTLSMRLCYYA